MTGDAPTYYAADKALRESYDRAVGEALELGIKVYHPGGAAKALGDLRDEIRAARAEAAR